MSRFALKHPAVTGVVLFVLLLSAFPATSHAAATLAWAKPTNNADGSPCTDLAGYRIYYNTDAAGPPYRGRGLAQGRSPILVPVSILSDPENPQFTLAGLLPNVTYNITLTAVDTAGNESAYSNEVSVLELSPGNPNSGNNQNSGTPSSGATGPDKTGNSLLDFIQTVIDVFGNSRDSRHLEVVEDTYVHGITPRTNFSTGSTLSVYTALSSDRGSHVVMKFDLSAIPAAAQIDSALLSLYQSDADGDAEYPLAAHEILGRHVDISRLTWDTSDGTSPWDHGGSLNIGEASDSVVVDSTEGYKEWNITDLVQKWVSDPDSNEGLLILPETNATPGTYRYFFSSESRDADKRPVLVIMYTASMGEDTDQDGASDLEEGTSDSDVDGIPDWLDKKIATKAFKKGSMSIVANHVKAKIVDTKIVAEAQTEESPLGITFPFGGMSYQVTDLSPGESILITIMMDEELPRNASYWQHKDAVGFEEIPSQVTATEISFELTDGDVGDADGIANGVIDNLGFVGVAQSAPLANSPDDAPIQTAGTRGGSGGGCSLSTSGGNGMDVLWIVLPLVFALVLKKKRSFE